jgi:hypothetical protein
MERLFLTIAVVCQCDGRLQGRARSCGIHPLDCLLLLVIGSPFGRFLSQNPGTLFRDIFLRNMAGNVS